jgi:hypothetical protein
MESYEQDLEELIKEIPDLRKFLLKFMLKTFPDITNPSNLGLIANLEFLLLILLNLVHMIPLYSIHYYLLSLLNYKMLC